MHGYEFMVALWSRLYLMIWLAFAQFLLVLSPLKIVELHAVIGGIILVLAHYNNRHLKTTATPSRIKRIVKSTAMLATVQPILGILLFLNLRSIVALPFSEFVSFAHLTTALAIMAQSASTATAFDMWEEKEFVVSPA